MRLLRGACGLALNAGYLGTLNVLATPLNCQWLETHAALKLRSSEFPEMGGAARAAARCGGGGGGGGLAAEPAPPLA